MVLPSLAVAGAVMLAETALISIATAASGVRILCFDVFDDIGAGDRRAFPAARGLPRSVLIVLTKRWNPSLSGARTEMKSLS